MRIDIHARDLPEDSEKYNILREFTRGVIEAAAKHIDVPLSSIERIIVAEDEFYLTAIMLIDPKEGFTNFEMGEHVFKGVGKTIKHISKSGSISNSIVLNSEIILKLYVLFNAENKSDESDLAMAISYSIVCHELAHCKDNIRRRDKFNLSPDEVYKQFRIRLLAEYSATIMLSEFAACFLSAKFIHPENHRDDLKSYKSEIPTWLNYLSGLVDNFDDTPQNRNNIAFQAAGTFWRILIVYTGFYGSKLGNEKLAEIPTQPWPGAKEKAEVIFEQLEFLLRTAGETYPNWSDDILFNGPYLLWHSLTQLYGFTFTEGELVDSISLPL